MARSFNGSSDKIVIGAPAVLSITGKISIHARVKFAALPAAGTTPTIVTKGSDGSHVPYFLDYNRDTGGGETVLCWRCGTYDGAGGDRGIYVTTPTIDVWYSVTGKYDGTKWTLFVDGAAGTPTTSIGAVSGTADVSIGCMIASGTPIRFLNGAVADVAIWNTDIPDRAIAAIAKGASPSAAHPDGLVGYWPLLGDSPAPDYSGNRNSGTLTGTTVVNHPGVRPGLLPPPTRLLLFDAAGTPVSTVAVIPCESLTRPAATAAAAWETLLAQTAQASAVYEALARPAASRQLPLEAIAAPRASSALAWETLVGGSTQAVAVYEALARPTASRQLPLESLAAPRASPAFAWETLARAGTLVVVPIEGLAGVAAVVVGPWMVFGQHGDVGRVLILLRPVAGALVEISD